MAKLQGSNSTLIFKKKISDYYIFHKKKTNTHFWSSKFRQSALEYKHDYYSFLSSQLAVKQDIAVTMLLRCTVDYLKLRTEKNNYFSSCTKF